MLRKVALSLTDQVHTHKMKCCPFSPIDKEKYVLRMVKIVQNVNHWPHFIISEVKKCWPHSVPEWDKMGRWPIT